MAPYSTFKMLYAFLLCFMIHSWCLSASNIDNQDQLHDCGVPECIVLDGRTKDNVKVNANKDGSARLFTFCYKGQNRELLRLWMNPKLSIIKSSESQEISVYFGRNLTEVNSHAQNLSPWWKYIMSLTLQVKEDVSLQPFNTSCIGISSVKPYSVEFKVKNPELWFVAYVLVGVILLFCAPVLSRNVMIHYGTGVSVGVLASILLIAYILQRLLPQKLKAIGNLTILIGGSTSLFILKWMSTRIQDLIHDHWQYVFGYILVTGFISFAVVYKYGPIKENRSLNLLQWSLQIIGLALIYNGTQISEASIAIIILVITFYVFPTRYIHRLKQAIIYKVFPPRLKFLTEEEYFEMKDRETEKALEELREYCLSPKCDSWKVISRIKSPSRFASFVEGDNHLSEDEYYTHNVYSHQLSSADEDDMSEIDFRLASP